MKTINLGFQALLLLLIFGAWGCKTSQSLSKNKKIVMDSMPIVVLETSMGTIEVELFANTPKHRDNFVKLVQEGYYNDLLFHRVIKNFMVQGGDPNSRNAGAGASLGTGGPGYTVPAEFVSEHRHFKGALAAARQGDNVNPTKASSGSQFYMVQGKAVDKGMLDQIERYYSFKYTEEERQRYQNEGGTPHLDGQYTVFGQIILGLDILDKIAATPCNSMDRPKEDVKIIKAYIRPREVQ